MSADAIQFGLPGVLESVPVREKGKFASAMDQAKEFAKAVGDDEILFPSQAALLLGVSPTRITDLMDEGRLQTARLGSRRVILMRSFKAFYESDRKPGRPRKTPTVKEVWKASKEGAKQWVKGNV